MRYLKDGDQAPPRRRKSAQAVAARQTRLVKKHEAAKERRSSIGMVRSTIPDGVTILR